MPGQEPKTDRPQRMQEKGYAGLNVCVPKVGLSHALFPVKVQILSESERITDHNYMEAKNAPTSTRPREMQPTPPCVIPVQGLRREEPPDSTLTGQLEGLGLANILTQNRKGAFFKQIMRSEKDPIIGFLLQTYYQCTPRIIVAKATASAVGTISLPSLSPWAAIESGKRW